MRFSLLILLLFGSFASARELASKTESGGQKGDTFNGRRIIAVNGDTKYTFAKDPRGVTVDVANPAATPITFQWNRAYELKNASGNTSPSIFAPSTANANQEIVAFNDSQSVWTINSPTNWNKLGQGDTGSTSFNLNPGETATLRSDGTSAIYSIAGGERAWEPLNAANPSLLPGKYLVESAVPYTVLPNGQIGDEWEFETGPTLPGVVTFGVATDTFDGVVGVFEIDKADAWFKLIKTGATAYKIAHEKNATIPPLFGPAGAFDASTDAGTVNAGTPDLTLPANQADGSQNFVYYITSDDTITVPGLVAQPVLTGGQLQWWGTEWRYLAPDQVATAGTVAELDAGTETAAREWSPKDLSDYIDANKMLTGAIAPIDGGTTAWFAGQQYTDTTTGKVYRATAASADPLATSLGSAWVPTDWSSQIFTASFTTTGRNKVRHRANTTGDTTLTIDTDLYSEGDLKEVTNTNTGTVTVALTGANQFADIGGNTPTLDLNQGETLRLVRNVGPFWTVLNRYSEGSNVLQFSSITEADAATTNPGDLIIVGYGSNHLGTWYHHGNAPSVFNSALESVYTEIEVEGFDAASDWMTSTNYVGIERKVFRITTPATMGAGQFFSSNGVVLQPSTEYLGAYVADRTAGDSVAAIADDQATINEFALIRIFEPVVAFDTDDISDWTSGETGLLRGELRKFTGLSGTQIFSRVANGNDAGGASPGADWQDITSQLSEAITLISAAGAGGGFNAIMGHPTPTRYEVIGTGLPLNIGYPPDGSDDKGRSEVFNNSDVVVTIAGVEIAPGSGAIVAAHGQATPLVTPLGKDKLIGLGDTPVNYTDGTPGDTLVLNAASDGFEFSDPPLTGNAVERLVFVRNRDQTFTFGDLQFSVPSAAFSSLRMRRGSNPSMAITHFATHWSNQQGAASEAATNFTLTTSWRAFRTSGLNLTQHNNYQFGTFVCNGWYYRVGVYVGSGWTNNRFLCTRWRLDGVKGLDGTDGKGIVTAHRSDGSTAIGGTVYTLDHVVYEYTDGTFQDMGLLMSPPAARVDGYTYSGIDVANSSFGSGAINFNSSSFNTIHDPKGLVDPGGSTITIDSPEKAGSYFMALNVTSGTVPGRVNARVNGNTVLIAAGEDGSDSDAAFGVVELVEGDVVTLSITGSGTTYGVSFTMSQTIRFIDETQYVDVASVIPIDQTGIAEGDLFEADGAGGLRKSTSGTVYSNAADQAIPNALVNTYATDIPALEVGDTITVVVARGVRVYDLTSRFIGNGFVYDHEVKDLEWTTEIVGSQLRLQAVAGGGTQTVKAIFIDR